VVARRLAQTGFKGWTYGANPHKKQIDRVQFILAVVEESAQVRLAKRTRARVLISDLSEGVLKRDGYALVVREDPRTKGVQEALDAAGIGDPVDPKDAAPGDLIQDWMKQSDGSWFGHAAIVETVTHVPMGTIRARLYGAHRSQNAIATATFDLTLNARSDRKIDIVRLRTFPDHDQPRPTPANRGSVGTGDELKRKA
jgi:hypothetical protein